jgi:hypothetical protein
MPRSVPPPLLRVQTRLLSKDALGLMLERTDIDAVVACAKWQATFRPACTTALNRCAPAMANLLHMCFASSRSKDGASELSLAQTMFGIGLVVGCQLRDRAESGQATICSISFDNALRQLESSEVRHSLWAVGLPDDDRALSRMVRNALESLPSLRRRLMCRSKMAFHRTYRHHQESGELLFFTGLLAAGIDPPTSLAHPPSRLGDAFP